MGRGLIVVAKGRLTMGALAVRCAVGRGGVRADKQEGDEATPAGVFAVREVLYRADRMAPPATGLPASVIAWDDGWSDDPVDPGYNRRTTTASRFRHEALWRDDCLYDVLAVIGVNDSPAAPGRGSAIFLHVAREDYAGTEGCVAVALGDLLRVLERCGVGTQIEISG